MALYWPEEKVALDIVDDPYRTPFEGDDSYTVLRVTCADLCNYDSYSKVMKRLCELLGKEAPDMPGWEDANRTLHSTFFSQVGDAMDVPTYPFPDYFEDEDLSNVEIVASSEEEGARMRAAAHSKGQYVRGISVWDGPVPKGSFEAISETTRMSTPEYFFLRKANQLPFVEAVCMGIELCGKYRTQLTQYDKSEGYDFLKTPRTSKDTLRHYLRDIRNTKEGKRAKRILRHVLDQCSSPMSCYLYVLLCLPRSQGSYGFERPGQWGPVCTDKGFLPASSGDYLMYDLFWPKKLVAVQYTGEAYPRERDFVALATENVRVVCVTDDDLADPEKFDAVAQRIAKLLDVELPNPSEKWIESNKHLRHQLPIPAYNHMKLTMHDITEHYVA